MNTIDVIIFGGQSNMQGQSECLTETEIVNNAYEYRYLTDELINLQNPVGENMKSDFTEGYFFENDIGVKWVQEHILGGACYKHTNLVPEFSRAYTEITGNEVVAVHVAKGSTEIDKWLKGTLGYEALCKKSLKAIEKVGKENIGHIYFMWLQGESDAIAGNSKSYYKEKLVELCQLYNKRSKLICFFYYIYINSLLISSFINFITKLYLIVYLIT